MGLFDILHAFSRDLNPVSPSVGVYVSMVKDTPTTMLLKESMFSFSGDDFSVTDVSSGLEVLKVKGSMFSFHDRKSEAIQHPC